MIDRRIACFPDDKALLARMRRALGPAANFEAFSSVPPLVEAIRSGQIKTTVVSVNAANIDKNILVLRTIRLGFTSHPLVAHYDPQGLSPRNLLSLAQSGVDDLVQIDVDDSRHLFGPILEKAQRRAHAQILVDRLAADIPLTLRSVFSYALDHAGESLDVPELAAALGVNQRTLTWRLSQHMFPSPRAFLTWCRLLVAGLLLDERAHTLDSVAELLNFSSGHALGNVLHRYMGRGVLSMREEGVSTAVIDAFRKRTMKKQPSLPVTLAEG